MSIIFLVLELLFERITLYLFLKHTSGVEIRQLFLLVMELLLVE